MGLTARDLAEALADAAGDDTGSTPTRPYGAPDIGVDIHPTWLDQRPAAWQAFGYEYDDFKGAYGEIPSYGLPIDQQHPDHQPSSAGPTPPPAPKETSK